MEGSEKRTTRNVMNVESPWSFNSLVDCVNDGTLTPQQLLTISERLLAASNSPLTDLASTASMDQADYSPVCLDKSHSTSKCPHIRNPRTFIRMRNRNFQSRPTGRANNDSRGRCPTRDRRDSSPNGNQGEQRTPLTGQPGSHAGTNPQYGIRSGPPSSHPTGAQEGPTLQVQRS